MIKRIHVNQHVIKANARDNTHYPTLTCKTSKSNVYGHEIQIQGASRVVYSPNKPLSCGAKVWIETTDPVTIINTELNHAFTLD